jgi:transposase
MSNGNQVDALTPSQRRRRFSIDQKVKILEEALRPGMTVSCVARLHGISPSLVFHWRRCFSGWAHPAPAPNDVDGRSKLQWLETRVRELERMLGKMTLDNETLRQAVRASVNTAPNGRPPVSGADPESRDI